VNRKEIMRFVWFSAVCLYSAGCNSAKSDEQAEAPPAVKVETVEDHNIFQVEKPEQFTLTAAVVHVTTSQLKVTGSINPDISKNVPVISLASGRVVEIHARLGDTVSKGQLLLKVQSADVSGAFSDYHKAVNDERLTNLQLDRTKMLYEKGAAAKSAFEAAENAEQDAQVTVETAAEHLHVLGVDKDHPTGVVDIFAPVSGVITDQQVTNAAGIQALSSSNPFTISDLSSVWVICDVYENDLAKIHLGEKAEISLNAYPDKIFGGVISNIGPVMDPNIRTAKVRMEVHNPGQMRLGMFVTATFNGTAKESHTAVPASAVLHLHDRDWVFMPVKDKQFRRVEVVGGAMLPGNMQEIVSGLAPGQKVLTNALQFQNSVEQ